MSAPRLHSAFGIARPSEIIEGCPTVCEACNRPAPFTTARRPSMDDDYTIEVGPCCDPHAEDPPS